MVYTLLALIVISNVSYAAILIRLRVKGNSLYEKTEDGILLLGSIRPMVRVIELIASGRQAELKDRFLVVAGYVFIASFLVNLPLMFIYALGR